jgi:hypothetical protein
MKLSYAGNFMLRNDNPENLIIKIVDKIDPVENQEKHCETLIKKGDELCVKIQYHSALTCYQQAIQNA